MSKQRTGADLILLSHSFDDKVVVRKSESAIQCGHYYHDFRNIKKKSNNEMSAVLNSEYWLFTESMYRWQKRVFYSSERNERLPQKIALRQRRNFCGPATTKHLKKVIKMVVWEEKQHLNILIWCITNKLDHFFSGERTTL